MQAIMSSSGSLLLFCTA